METAFRAVNRTPPSPISGPADENSGGQFVGHFKDKFLNFVGHSLNFNDRPALSVEDGRSLDSSGHLKGEFENFEDRFLGMSTGFESHSLGYHSRLKDIPLSFALSTVSALFADDRLPLRYLESLMRRLSSGRDPGQAALTFDGYGLSWSWRLDSDSLSSLWLASTDLDSLSLLVDSAPTDDWSMQPASWSVDPPTAAYWSAQTPAVHDWSVDLPTSDVDQLKFSSDSPRNCSMLPALQRPLSGLLLTTNSCLTEFPDNSTDVPNFNGDFQIPGGIFCECCGQSPEHQLSAAADADTSWDQLDTVDFYVDDGTEVLAGYSPEAADRLFYSMKRRLGSGDEDDKELYAAETGRDDIVNDLLHTADDIAETLV